MILYLDASALVKRYVAERGSLQVAQVIARAEAVGSSLICRAETAAALSKAVRTKTLTRDEAASALQVFRSEWPSLVRVQTTETLIARADTLAWELGLRGYDAVHLASALVWQDGLGEPVTMATFDLRLWKASGRHSLALFPDDLPAMLSEN